MIFGGHLAKMKLWIVNPFMKEGLKTPEERTLSFGTKLAEFLHSIAPKKKTPEQFLFQVKEGKFIDFNNFANKTWKIALKNLGIKQRNPY
jgi:integrase